MPGHPIDTIKLKLIILVTWISLGGTAIGAGADLILDWNTLMLDAIRQEDSGPTLSSRNLAILHAAIYDSINSITRTHQPYRFLVDAPAGASPELAAAAAAYEVIVSLYPTVKPGADALYGSETGDPKTPASLSKSVSVGQAIARAILDWRSADGSATSVPYIPSDAPGQWRRSPPFFRPPLDPQWRYVTPFCLEDIEPFVATNLPALNSAEYAAAFQEVKALGEKNSLTRTAEQSQIAMFWSDFSYTATPPGHWHETAAAIVRQRETSLAEAARLFALLSLAQADAAIVCWEAKYRFNSWRPVTAIQRADEDGNPETLQNPNWTQFLPSPPFPEYPSGHSTFSKASGQVLTHFYGTDAIAFTATSDSLPGVSRAFTSLAACVDEVGMSRIYGGFHFQFSNRDGKASGKKIGDYVSRNFLLANENLPLVLLEGVDHGLMRLRVHGQIGTACVLESSLDLVGWQPISTNAAAIGGVQVTDRLSAGSPSKFYRVR